MDVFEELKAERKRQDDMWGTDFDSLNTPNDWVAYIVRYVSEGAYDGSKQKYNVNRFREFLVKAAAITIAAIQTIDRRGKLAPRHYEEL